MTTCVAFRGIDGIAIASDMIGVARDLAIHRTDPKIMTTRCNTITFAMSGGYRPAQLLSAMDISDAYSLLRTHLELKPSIRAGSAEWDDAHSNFLIDHVIPEWYEAVAKYQGIDTAGQMETNAIVVFGGGIYIIDYDFQVIRPTGLAAVGAGRTLAIGCWYGMSQYENFTDMTTSQLVPFMANAIKCSATHSTTTGGFHAVEIPDPTIITP